MYKVLAVDGEVEIAQTKVLKVPPADDPHKSFNASDTSVLLDPALLQHLRYRPFGAPRGSASAVRKRFGEPAKAGDEGGDLQMNGLLISACLADETASASTARTAGKSAFTYALLDRLDALGPHASNRQLVEATTARLRDLGFRQTPVLMEPARPAGLAGRPFLVMGAQPAAPPSPTVPAGLPDWLRAILERITKEQPVPGQPASMAVPVGSPWLGKDFQQPAPNGQEKFLDIAISIASVAIPQLVRVLRKGGFEPSKAYVAMPGGEEKFWRTLLAAVTTGVPAVVRALRKSGYELQKDYSGDQEKSLADIFRIVNAAMWPILCEAGMKPGSIQKDLWRGGEALGCDRHNSCDNGSDDSAPGHQRLNRQGLPTKAFEDLPTDDKRFRDAIANVFRALGPVLMDAMRKSGIDPQKDLQQAGQEKFVMPLIAAVTTIAPHVLRMLSKGGVELGKDLDGDDKFWREFARIMETALPAVVGALGKGDLLVGEQGLVAVPTGDGAGDDKLWRMVARIVTVALPRIVDALAKSGAQPEDDIGAMPPPPEMVAGILSSALPGLARVH